jgi:hypothetical protein
VYSSLNPPEINSNSIGIQGKPQATFRPKPSIHAG